MNYPVLSHTSTGFNTLLLSVFSLETVYYFIIVFNLFVVVFID